MRLIPRAGNIGPVVVGDVGAFAGDGVDAEVGIVGGEGAGGDGDASGVVRVAVGAVGVGAEGVDGVGDAGGVVRVAVTADVSVDVGEGIVGGVGVGSVVVKSASRVDDAAGVVVVVVAVVVGVDTRGRWGVSEVGDDEPGLVKVERVR
jgi:hypothetical protein